MRNNPPSPLTPANRPTADAAGRTASVQELFDAALELSPESRAAFLDEACRADPDLRRGVGDLLAVLDRAHTAELFPPLADAPRGLLAFGERIGPYRVLHELGAGGMGVVFLAERDDIEKRVALKLVREGGLASGDRVRRFLLERRVLARLEHPNIARLLDAGVTELRLPYFAMEYVSGTPIDRYCDERRLPIAERLSLFRTVCEAVHHAHQNLVVHRDLKPSNILVTADGQVKLLDFGIAKLLAHHESSPAEEARTGLLMLTPEYASPEQVRGEPVTTASDIYSLGVVLYQLLTGHRPYRFNAKTPAEVERVVCREAPQRPSEVVTRTVTGAQVAATHAPVTPEWVGVARNTSPERLRRRLRGDLDTMVMKALSKEPGRRYVSAAQFADDLRRHLVGLPVLARKDTASYRAGKFLRRHLVGVVAVIVLVSTLVAGVVSTAWQAQRAEAQRIVAEERFRDVHSLATTVLFEIHDAIADLPGATRARALIVDRGLDYLGRLTRQGQGDDTLERESAEAYIRLGMAQGIPHRRQSGRSGRRPREPGPGPGPRVAAGGRASRRPPRPTNPRPGAREAGRREGLDRRRRRRGSGCALRAPPLGASGGSPAVELPRPPLARHQHHQAGRPPGTSVVPQPGRSTGGGSAVSPGAGADGDRSAGFRPAPAARPGSWASRRSGSGPCCASRGVSTNRWPRSSARSRCARGWPGRTAPAPRRPATSRCRGKGSARYSGSEGIWPSRSGTARRR